MNYRHSFHAGNHADVIKHIALVRCLEYLKRKDKPFRVIDTHAGKGLYDLGGAEAMRSPEWRDGVARLLAKPLSGEAGALVAPYVNVVRAANEDDLVWYPGSPAIVRHLVRPQDRVTAVELNEAEHQDLAALFSEDPQVKVIRLDGWLALKAQVPPKERRGLVLVDPPFELTGEFDRLASGLREAVGRWASGVFLLWYPIKEGLGFERFGRSVAEIGLTNALSLRLTVRNLNAPGLSGSGLIVVNPPYVFADEMKTILSELCPILAQDAAASWHVHNIGQSD